MQLERLHGLNRVFNANSQPQKQGEHAGHPVRPFGMSDEWRGRTEEENALKRIGRKLPKAGLSTSGNAVSFGADNLVLYRRVLNAIFVLAIFGHDHFPKGAANTQSVLHYRRVLEVIMQMWLGRITGIATLP